MTQACRQPDTTRQINCQHRSRCSMARELTIMTACLVTTLVWLYEFICLPSGAVTIVLWLLSFLLINFFSFKIPEAERRAMEATLEVLVATMVHVYELLAKTNDH